jgi:hypothetical protein
MIDSVMNNFILDFVNACDNGIKPSEVIRHVAPRQYCSNADVGRAIGYLIETGALTIGKNATLYIGTKQ